MLDRINILDIPIDRVDFFQALGRIEELVEEKGYHQVATVNPEFVVHSMGDDEFKKALVNSSLNTPDGIGIVWASKFLSINTSNFVSKVFWCKITLLAILFNKKWLMSEIKERVAGVDLMWDLAKMGQSRGWRFFLLGGMPGVADSVKEKLNLLYPKLNIVGTYAGTPGEEGMEERVSRTDPDIVFVAYGNTKQEKYIYQNLEKLKAKVVIGIGGSFDFIIEKTKRAPVWMQMLGIEWVYRLLQQPSRAGRIFNAFPKFVWKVFWGK